MKQPIWTAEKLAALSRSQLEQLRINATRLANLELVRDCDLELGCRLKPKRATQSHSLAASQGEVVVGYHFVCQGDRGVQVNADGTFWSGSWVVAEENILKSLKYGAYLALHNSKAELSYRQGKIVAFRKAVRSMISKHGEGIEFCVQPESIEYEWIGDGAGEKGYKWSKLHFMAESSVEDKGE